MFSIKIILWTNNLNSHKVRDTRKRTCYTHMAHTHTHTHMFIHCKDTLPHTPTLANAHVCFCIMVYKMIPKIYIRTCLTHPHWTYCWEMRSVHFKYEHWWRNAVLHSQFYINDISHGYVKHELMEHTNQIPPPLCIGKEEWNCKYF